MKSSLSRSLTLAVLVFGYSLVAGAANEVVGTIELTLDGEQQTWYVLDPGEDMLPNALWVAMGPEMGALSISAYRDRDQAFVRDEATGSPLPDGDAAALVFSIGFPLGARQQQYALPAEPPAGPAVILLVKNWSNPVVGWALDDGPGEIQLTRIEAKTNGVSSFAGTFHGTMRSGSGETRSLENGRFEISRAEFFQGRPSGQ